MKKTLIFSILFSLFFLYTNAQERIWYRDAEVAGYVANLQTLSNADIDRTIDIINPNGSITKVGYEGDLREALTNLRNDPLIGVKSITDPRGETIYYEYDEFNRLKYVKDADGNILSKNKYHYKNQQ